MRPSISGPISERPNLPSLTTLEPFGWIFTPAPLPSDAISAEAALSAVGILSDRVPGGEISIASGLYTEKGRYRQVDGARRVTLYADHPVWVMTIVPSDTAKATESAQAAASYSRHTLVDARTGQLITEFLGLDRSGEHAPLDLHLPLAHADLTQDEAVVAAIAGEERVLGELPTTAEYGSRWRLIPGFTQVTDVWRVTFDTSSLPPNSPSAEPEVAWVVIVDDKAGHRWLSAALQEPPSFENEGE